MRPNNVSFSKKPKASVFPFYENNKGAVLRTRSAPTPAPLSRKPPARWRCSFWLPVCTPSCNGGLQYWQTINSTGNCAEAAVGAGDCELFKLSACSVVVSTLNRCQRVERSTPGSRSWINSASYNKAVYLLTYTYTGATPMTVFATLHTHIYQSSWLLVRVYYLSIGCIHTYLLFQRIFLYSLSKNLKSFYK